MNTTQTPEAAAHGAGEGAAAVSGQTSVKSAADTGRESTEAGHGEPRTLSGGRGANLPAAPSDQLAEGRVMSETTPTGIPILHCDECDRTHPTNRKHCEKCGIASAFIDESGYCLAHRTT